MDEKMRILKMVEEGKISAEQAVELLNAVSAPDMENTGSPADLTPADSLYENRLLRIVVDSPQGDKVNVQLPVKIIRQVLKVTGKLPIQDEGMADIDLEALTASVIECLDSETLGNIVDVQAADGTTVKVFIG